MDKALLSAHSELTRALYARSGGDRERLLRDVDKFLAPVDRMCPEDGGFIYGTDNPVFVDIIICDILNALKSEGNDISSYPKLKNHSEKLIEYSNDKIRTLKSKEL